MAVYDTLPSQNLKFDDIRDTLNSNGGAVTNVVATAFQEGAKINPYSKYKPSYIGDVPFTDINGTFVVDIASRPSLSIKDKYWVSKNGLCGFILPDAKLDVTDPNDEVWGVEQPKAPYRLGDFRGYNAKASKLLFTITVPNSIIIGQGATVIFNLLQKSSNELSFFDIFRDDLGFKPKLYVKAFLYGYPSNSTYQSIKEISNLVYGENRISFSANELTFPNMYPNNDLCFHFYITNTRELPASLKNSSEAKTFYKVNLLSNEPFTFMALNGQVLQDRVDTNKFQLWNMQFGLNAVGYAGGTLPSGSMVSVYEYKTDSTDYTREFAVWESSMSPALTVASGETKRFPYVSDRENFNHTLTPGVNKMVLLWWNRNLNKVYQQKTFPITQTIL